MNKFLALVLVFLLTACSGTAVTQSPTSAGSVSASAPSGAEKPWSYDDQAAWEIVDGLLATAPPVEFYEPGTWGPASADRVGPRGGWHDPSTSPQTFCL